MGIVIIDIKIKHKKLKIPQNTDPKNIKEIVIIKLLLSSLLKINGVCKTWSIRQIKQSTIRPVKKPLV